MLQRCIAFITSIILFFSAGPFSGDCTPARAGAAAKNPYAAAGYGITAQLLKERYNIVRHTMRDRPDRDGMPFVWPAASFIETMADAYRLFPCNVRLKLDYCDALSNALKQYLVEDAGITTPGGVVRGVSYYNASAGNQDDYYYDDNEWVCIRLLLGYQQLGRVEFLKAAQKNLDFLWTGWDDKLGGGIYWYKDFAGKNACSNAPAAIAFLLAYQCTGSETYLEKGKIIYDWMNVALRENDLFIDSIAVASGAKNRWKGVYNQATMIYAGSLLYEITGDETYYELTRRTVNATFALMFREEQTADGTVEIRMNGNPIFKAWCVGWLARSYVKYFETDPAKDTQPMDMLKAVLDRELLTRTEDGLYDPFFCSGESDPDNVSELLAQTGVASAFLCAAYYDVFLTGA